jgi:hypothetical protein
MFVSTQLSRTPADYRTVHNAMQPARSGVRSAHALSAQLGAPRDELQEQLCIQEWFLKF